MSFSNKNNYLERVLFAIGGYKAPEFEDDAVYEKIDGHYLAKRQNARCFVQSKYSVPHEIESMFAAVDKTAEIIVLFGHGNGDAVRYALNDQNFPHLKSLIVVEPSLAWGRIVIHEMDLEKIWGENFEKVSVLVGYRYDFIGNIMANSAIYIQKDFSVVYHMSVRAIFPEYCSAVAAALTDQMRNLSVVLGTNKVLTHKIVYNEILNLACPAYDFVPLMDIFKGKNVIVVSAGPSLEKNIHLLEEAKKKAVVVAVGSAVRILDARGIIPHFRAALDPSPEEYAIFGKLKDDPVPLITINALYAEILVHYQGPIIRASTISDQLSGLLHKKRKYTIKSFNPLPTIANLAAEAFCASGCKRMVFIGQDMCMYDYQLHADSGQYAPLKNAKGKDMLELKDIYGNDVVAPRNYYFIKLNLENTVGRFANTVEFINATEGGLGLQGVPNRPLADVLAEWEEDDIAPVIEERLKQMELIEFQDELAELWEEIAEIDRLNDENLKNLQEAKEFLLKDESLLQRDRYIQTFKAAQKNEKELKKINWHIKYIHPTIESFLQMDCMGWQKDIDSDDEKAKFRSILEIQLRTAQTTKSLTIILNKAFKQAFSEEVKVNKFSLTVK